jgi:hypothetical protein
MRYPIRGLTSQGAPALRRRPERFRPRLSSLFRPAEPVGTLWPLFGVSWSTATQLPTVINPAECGTQIGSSLRSYVVRSLSMVQISPSTVRRWSTTQRHLLLFGIGLKVRLRTLARPVVWVGASLHAAATTACIGAMMLGLGAIGLPLAAELSLGQAALVGFAFSFSSTVFAVKALEERNETTSLQGRIAIGIFVVQDIFAVVFLTVAVDTPPSIWAIPVVFAVIAARPVYAWFIDQSGHGELLLLLGLALAIGVGAETFEQVGLKPDLGALIVGLTLASHPAPLSWRPRCSTSRTSC